MKNILIYTCLLLTLLLSGCGNTPNKKDGQAEEKKSSTNNQDKQLNISILLDLSNRIDPITNPETPQHFERDIADIRHITEFFVQDMEQRGAFKAKGKLKILFNPKPKDPNVNIYAEKLNIDLSNMDNKQKKEVHDNLTTIFDENLTKIYESTISQKNWIGSDIWRFFKNDVKDYCVDRDNNYRNILIILTDGYIYHLDSKDIEENRYAYLLPQNIQAFRNNTNWKQEIEKTDFGFICKRNDLENLEILVLEITPSKQYKNDEDIIKFTLEKWFKEMGVKRCAIYYSDLPQYTKQRITDFFK